MKMFDLFQFDELSNLTTSINVYNIKQLLLLFVGQFLDCCSLHSMQDGLIPKNVPVKSTETLCFFVYLHSTAGCGVHLRPKVDPSITVHISVSVPALHTAILTLSSGVSHIQEVKMGWLWKLRQGLIQHNELCAAGSLLTCIKTTNTPLDTTH